MSLYLAMSKTLLDSGWFFVVCLSLPLYHFFFFSLLEKFGKTIHKKGKLGVVY